MQLLALVLALGGAVGARHAHVGVDDTARREALARVRELRDAVESSVLVRIAAARDAAALEGLVEAAGLLVTPAAQELVYGLMAEFRGDRKLEERAVGVMEAAALGDDLNRCMPATAGLVAFGDPAIDALWRILERSKDPAVRATALGPLQMGLRLEGSLASLDTLLDAWRQPESGPYDLSVRALAGFRDEAHLRRFERVLGDRRTATELRALVLDALVSMPGDGPDGVLVRALDSDDATLQIAVIQALEARQTAGCERELTRLTEGGPVLVRAAAWIALAGRVPEDSRYRWRVGLLAKHSDPLLRAAAATVLGESRFEGAALELGKLLSDENWGVRDAALDACVASRSPALVPLLMMRLDDESVPHRERVRDTLMLLTAADHGGSSARWRAWWAAEGASAPLATLEVARAFVESRPKAAPGEGRSSVQFFGIPVTSDKVAFVIDSSGSMSATTGSAAGGGGGATRLQVAKARLLEVLERLDPRSKFNIIWFSSSTSAWRGRLTERSPRALRMARAFVDARVADGGTALYDGLCAAWRDRAVEAIYLLTDGQPSAGRLTAPEDILADLRARFERRPVVVHCIAVGTESPLLKDIAALTGGVYRAIY
ncbi:MAG: HEAT repeat domain-containing protein [Planctomycetota bacterium]